MRICLLEAGGSWILTNCLKSGLESAIKSLHQHSELDKPKLWLVKLLFWVGYKHTIKSCRLQVTSTKCEPKILTRVALDDPNMANKKSLPQIEVFFGGKIPTRQVFVNLSWIFSSVLVLLLAGGIKNFTTLAPWIIPFQPIYYGIFTPRMLWCTGQIAIIALNRALGKHHSQNFTSLFS